MKTSHITIIIFLYNRHTSSLTFFAVFFSSSGVGLDYAIDYTARKFNSFSKKASLELQDCRAIPV